MMGEMSPNDSALAVSVVIGGAMQYGCATPAGMSRLGANAAA
jgi:hypothetical protein